MPHNSAVTRSPQLPWDELTFRFPQSLPEILAKDSLSAHPRGTLSASNNYPRPPPRDRPRAPRDLQARRVHFRPRLLARMLGKATAEKQTFRGFAEAGRAHSALTAG